MSDDESIVEEEYLVYAELSDNVDPNIFKHAESSFSSFAIDSDQPLLIIGGQAFVGTYKDTVGTAVFLEETPEGSAEQIGIGNEPSDPVFVNSPAKRLQYVAHTRKTLEMSRVLLIDKNDQCNDAKGQEEEKDYLEEDFVELENNLQNDEMKDRSRLDEEVSKSVSARNQVTDIAESVDISTKTENSTDLASTSPLELEENQVIEDIEQMKISTNVGNSDV